MTHLLANNMIKDTQHGFMPKKSTVSNLIEYIDDISSYIDNGKSVCSLMTDFSKCFDKLPKKLIKHCLEKRYSIEGNVIRWIGNWIEDRKQRVILNGVFSNWIEVKSGCVQGSLLGPIIALCLLDTVDDHIKYVKVSKYADDDKFYAPINNEDEKKMMQEDIDRIIKWAKEWGFILNSNKCQILQFGGKVDYDFYMNDKLVEKKPNAKDLGVIVDNKLNWADQIKRTVGKAKRRAYCMSKAIISKNAYTRSIIYKCYIRLILN